MAVFIELVQFTGPGIHRDAAAPAYVAEIDAVCFISAGADILQEDAATGSGEQTCSPVIVKLVSLWQSRINEKIVTTFCVSQVCTAAMVFTGADTGQGDGAGGFDPQAGTSVFVERVFARAGNVYKDTAGTPDT